MTKEERDIQRKLRVLQYADTIGDVSKACRYFGIGRASFYPYIILGTHRIFERLRDEWSAGVAAGAASV